MVSDMNAKREIPVWEERLSQLCDAFLRINESLEFEAVLQETLDSARSLTGARYGVIVLVTDQREAAEFLFSGMTAELAGELEKLPNKWELFEHFFAVEEPLRLQDFQGHLKEHGLSEFRSPLAIAPATAYLGAPIRHQDQRVGAIFMAEKEGGFSAEDQEILVLFASQAALVISNARQFRQEQRARADLETLINTAPMSVLVFDVKTKEMRSINREALRLIGDQGLTSESLYELLSTGTYRFSDGRVISQHGVCIGEAMISGETIRDEDMIIEFSDGKEFVLNVNATPITAADGSVESVIVTAQDMAPLAEMERQRTEFVAMVGHELRSPLTAIKGSTINLLESQSLLDPAEMIEYHRIIDEQADYMRDLINNLTDMVRIETGTLSVNPVPSELDWLVDEARNIFLNTGGREHIRIDLSSDLPLVMADRRRIVQVIVNLLANASRHSNDKSTISLGAQVQDIHVAVSVADNGQGISADQMPHLFTKFSQSDDPDQSSDLGLGLAICKGVVEAHGGRIWAESDGPGLGSRFTFTIPVSDESTPHVAPQRTKAAARPQRTVSSELTRILAVDDDPRTLKHVRDSLTKEGYEPVVTGDPDEVVSLFQETDPQVVLLDLMLPGKDGIDLMKDLLAIRDTPVIFVSGYDQDELITKAFEMGAVDYMVKPFSSTELAARVRAALRKKPEQPLSFELGDLAINFAERSVSVAGEMVELTPTEFRLLSELSAKAGTAMDHDLLLQKVWGPDQPGDARRMRTVVKNLRQKLGDDARNPRYIVTVPHVGYRMPKA
ncbi:MAG: response regulator [Acidimicrobiia bacterium]|nr:response regulator [Acidimicrobiia bacterium]